MSSVTCMLLVFLIAFAGNAIQTVVGFGFMILCMALLPMFLPISQCLILAQTAGTCCCLSILWGKFGKIDLRYTGFPVIFATVGSLVGLLFFSSISTAGYMKALGIVLILLALWMWRFSKRFHIRSTPLNGAICGGIAGVLGAFFGVSVPPLVLYYSSEMTDKERYMISLQFTLLVQTAACLFGRIAMGQWTADTWQLLPAAIAGLLLGKLPGKWVYGRLDVDRLKIVIYIFIALLGIYTFFSK